jgi:hypothetical protein
MGNKILLMLILPACLACKSNSAAKIAAAQKKSAVIDTSSMSNLYPMVSAIPMPEGFSRTGADSGSFTAWLGRVQLKKDRTVYLFNGIKKSNQSAQFAVLNLSVGSKNLQQCADAVMRLRAEYFYQHKKFEQIVFTDNEGRSYVFHPPYSKENFQRYLDKVFGMCGTASLAKQLKKIGTGEIQPGSVLIRGGFPGHAVIVLDMAVNNKGKRIYLLAQSYMPAQDIHILQNPMNETLSPWYEVNDDKYIETPEYTFTTEEWMDWEIKKP